MASLSGGNYVSYNDIVNSFMRNGLSRQQALNFGAVMMHEGAGGGGRGYTGNFGRQSTENGGVLNQGGAYGLAQWNGPRQAGLASHAASMGLDPSHLDAQTSFAIKEAQQRGVNLGSVSDIVNRFEVPAAKYRAGEIAGATRMAGGAGTQVGNGAAYAGGGPGGGGVGYGTNLSTSPYTTTGTVTAAKPFLYQAQNFTQDFPSDVPIKTVAAAPRPMVEAPAPSQPPPPITEGRSVNGPTPPPRPVDLNAVGAGAPAPPVRPADLSGPLAQGAPIPAPPSRPADLPPPGLLSQPVSPSAPGVSAPSLQGLLGGPSGPAPPPPAPPAAASPYGGLAASSLFGPSPQAKPSSGGLLTGGGAGATMPSGLPTDSSPVGPSPAPKTSPYGALSQLFGVTPAEAATATPSNLSSTDRGLGAATASALTPPPVADVQTAPPVRPPSGMIGMRSAASPYGGLDTDKGAFSAPPSSNAPLSQPTPSAATGTAQYGPGGMMSREAQGPPMPPEMTPGILSPTPMAEQKPNTPPVTATPAMLTPPGAGAGSTTPFTPSTGTPGGAPSPSLAPVSAVGSIPQGPPPPEPTNAPTGNAGNQLASAGGGMGGALSGLLGAAGGAFGGGGGSAPQPMQMPQAQDTSQQLAGPAGQIMAALLQKQQQERRPPPQYAPLMQLQGLSLGGYYG